MMGRIFKAAILASLFFLICSNSFAASSSSFTTSVTLSGPTGINPIALMVMGDGTDPGDWANTTPQTNINFDPLTLYRYNEQGIEDPAGKFSIFLSDHFYSIDMAYTYGGGATISQVTASFVETAKPAGQPNGLGFKSTATFVIKRLDANGNEVTETPADIVSKVLLKDAATSGVSLTQLVGGWLRMYVGLVTKDPNRPDPSDVESSPEAEVFSPGDLPGAYSGILTISST